VTLSSTPDKSALIAKLWRAGKLRYKLHKSQKEVYDDYRAWEAHAFQERKADRILPGVFPRVFMFDISRRWGKDFAGLLIRIEDAIRRPGGRFTYATAYQKDISSIVVPLFHEICEDCPLDIKPEFKQSFQGTEAGFHFPNGSVILLIGIDRNPDGMRGRYSDGITISEAGFVDRLEYAILSVLYPQLQGKDRLHATVIVNSTPPEIPGTWYDKELLPDCKEHSRYAKRTIEDNPLLGNAQLEEFIRAAGGRDSERCRREYFVERIRSDDHVVLPEFSTAKHVRSLTPPKYGVGFTVIDPGVRDLCGVAVGYLDFELHKMVFKRSWAKRGANTKEVAEAIKELEADVFKDLRYWSGRAVVENPFQRFSDTEARMILDLGQLHKLKFAAADKQDSEAALNALRVALTNEHIIVDPAAKEMISHMENAVWNKNRTSYDRSVAYGHFDMVDVAKYAWRMMNSSLKKNPVPPVGHLHVMSGGWKYDRLFKPGDWTHATSITEKLASILPGGRKKPHTVR
jgi:hypothetical protein